MKSFIVGNWKMNGVSQSLAELDQLVAGADDALLSKVKLAICPPATLIERAAARVKGSSVSIGPRTVTPKSEARIPVTSALK